MNQRLDERKSSEHSRNTIKNILRRLARLLLKIDCIRYFMQWVRRDLASFVKPTVSQRLCSFFQENLCADPIDITRMSIYLNYSNQYSTIRGLIELDDRNTIATKPRV